MRKHLNRRPWQGRPLPQAHADPSREQGIHFGNRTDMARQAFAGSIGWAPYASSSTTTSTVTRPRSGTITRRTPTPRMVKVLKPLTSLERSCCCEVPDHGISAELGRANGSGGAEHERMRLIPDVSADRQRRAPQLPQPNPMPRLDSSVSVARPASRGKQHPWRPGS